MSNIIKKNEILDRLKIYYKLKTNADLSRFLDIVPTTLSSWYSRNNIDYDLIFTKCPEVDLNWLINGTEATRNSPKPILPTNTCPFCLEKERTIHTQCELITQLKERMEELKNMHRS